MSRSYLEQHPLWLALQTDAALPSPDIIQLELAAACDLSCVMCPLPHETRRGTGAERFDVADLERERAFFAAASGVELTGFGEILCHPQLLDCLRWFRKLGLSVQATTNGQRLTPDLIEAIVSEDLIDVLCISVDAATKSTYERIRARGDFARLQRNLDQLAAKRTDSPSRLYLSFAAMEPNIRELPDFVRWAGALGADRVIVQHIYEGPHTAGLGLQHHLDLARDLLAEAGALADELGLTLDGRNLFQHGGAGRTADTVKDCPFPWRHTFLKANRQVAACAMVWEDLDFGDSSQGLENIWRGENYTRFRRAMAGVEPPVACVRCQYFGWREAIPLAEISSVLSMKSEQRGQLGWGWHELERDYHGRFFRWSRAQASAFLRASGTILELDALIHADAPFLKGCVRLGEKELPFDSYDLWGKPLRLAVGELTDEVTRVDLRLDQPWNPGALPGIRGPRKLGLLTYGMRFVGKASELAAPIEARDPYGQLCRGWLPPEEAYGRTVRWTRETADFMLPAGGGELFIEALVPRGLAARMLRLTSNGLEIGARPLTTDSRWHTLHFACPVATHPRHFTLAIDGATPAPKHRDGPPRYFGMLVSALGFSG